MIELESYMAPIRVLHGNNGAQHRGVWENSLFGLAEAEIEQESSTSFAEKAWFLVRFFAGASELSASEANRRSG